MASTFVKTMAEDCRVRKEIADKDTSMNSGKLVVKVFADPASSLALPDVIPVFHGWIQKEVDLGGLLVDVADYSHVPDGPGVVLVGHEADYFLDTAEGPLGLLYNRKKTVDGDLRTRIKSAFRSAFDACRRLEQEPELKGKLSFQAGKVRFQINDRLHAPNEESTYKALESDLNFVVNEIYGEGNAKMAWEQGDPRRRLTVEIESKDGADVQTILDRFK